MRSLLTVIVHDPRPANPVVTRESKMTAILNIFSTRPRKRTQPPKVAALKIWTRFLQLFEPENSVSWSAH